VKELEMIFKNHWWGGGSIVKGSKKKNLSKNLLRWR